MTEAEAFLLAFHRDHPGCTSEAFAAGKSLESGQSSYELLSSLAEPAGGVLDLGCGDGHLLSLVQRAAPSNLVVGIDLSPDELARARALDSQALLVRGRAQTLPFDDHSFALVTSHLAFHLMSDIEAVVDEIARVLASGGRFAAIVGGGPKIGGVFEVFLELVSGMQSSHPPVPRIGDMRARTETGLQELFGAHPGFSDEVRIDDHYIDFGGTFEVLWPRLLTVYDLVHYSTRQLDSLRDQLAERLSMAEGEHIPCTMAIRRVICHRRLGDASVPVA